VKTIIQSKLNVLFFLNLSVIFLKKQESDSGKGEKKAKKLLLKDCLTLSLIRKASENKAIYIQLFQKKVD
jgi:hypothetical protein